MKSQVSRDSNRPQRRYSGVYQQQGRMITDADWNELVDVAKTRLRGLAEDSVQGGVPRDGGLKIDDDVAIVPGRLYADGVWAELPGEDPVAYDVQPDFPAPPALPDGTVPGTYRLYADVWERAVTSLEDAHLRDPGLHGADTCTRSQAMVQIKWCPDTIDPETSINPHGDAPLDLTLRQARTVQDPCDPCAQDIAIERGGLGSYLFRLEVHDVAWSTSDPREVTGLTLKWSTENGAEQHALGTTPEGFNANDWLFEFFNETSEKHLGEHFSAAPGFPVRGRLFAEGFPGEGDLPPGFPNVRRWDGYCELSRSAGTWTLVRGTERGQALQTAADGASETSDGFVSLGSAIRINLRNLILTLELEGQAFVAGDYWLAPVREEASDVGDTILTAAPPVGVPHRYLELARVSVDATGPTVLDYADDSRRRRLEFPPLTSLWAGDVGFVNACDNLYDDAQNVQQALDALCDIDAADIAYTVPECPRDPGTDPPTVQSRMRDLVAKWPDYDGDARTTVKDMLDALMCALDADKLPYDPTRQSSRWMDINEVGDLGQPPRPNTVQSALDDLVENLESTDLRYVHAPPCDLTPYGAPTAKVRLGINDTEKLSDLLHKVLCGLDAARVPFDNSECPARFPEAQTVQAALQALCNIQADTIGYTPDPACELAEQPDVDTVQDALDALCLRQSGGGGCRVTVGEGGHASVLEAIEALAAQGRRDFCLCLLPGEHFLPEGWQAANPGTHLQITGCGGSSQLKLGNEPVSFKSFASIGLENLEVRSKEAGAGIRFEDCGEVRLRSVHYTGVQPETPAFSIAGSARVACHVNTIEAYHPTMLEHPRAVFNFDESMRDIFRDLDLRTFRIRAEELAAKLAAEPLDSRRERAALIHKETEGLGNQLTPAELASYVLLELTLELAAVTADSMLSALLTVYRAAANSRSGLAVAIEDANARVTLEGNEIMGVVVLYGAGPPSTNPFTIDRANTLRDRIKERQLRFLPAAGNLELYHNRLTRIAVAESKINDVLKNLEAGQPEVEGIFGTTRLSDNVFEWPDNQLIGRSTSFSDTRFEILFASRFVGSVPQANAGFVLGFDAVFVGSHAPEGMSVSFSSITARHSEAATLNLNILG